MNLNYTACPSQPSIQQSQYTDELCWREIYDYYFYLFGTTLSLCSCIYFFIWFSARYEPDYESDSESGSESESESGSESGSESETNENAPIKELPYEARLFDEYDLLDDNELTDEFVKNLNRKTITDTTPRGDVFMYYGYDVESFIYHSKTKEIHYKYLETVARKYVILYKCKNLYIDIRKEYEKGLNNYNEIKEKCKNGEKDGGVVVVDKKKQLFASFKTYNRKSEVNSKQKDKIYILREKANRYSYHGKIEEYKEEPLPVSENEEGINKNIDFAMFKKMNL